MANISNNERTEKNEIFGEQLSCILLLILMIIVSIDLTYAFASPIAFLQFLKWVIVIIILVILIVRTSEEKNFSKLNNFRVNSSIS